VEVQGRQVEGWAAAMSREHGFADVGDGIVIFRHGRRGELSSVARTVFTAMH
jgi:hypothetical protein